MSASAKISTGTIGEPARLSKINLYVLQPLYGLAGVTMLTAVGFIIYMSAWSIALPDTFDEPGALLMGIPLALFALFTFLVPLLGIHRRPVQEKERALGETGARITQALTNFHLAVDSGNATQTIKDKELVAAIEYEYNLLNKIATWPWQPETPRILFTALVIPLVLFSIQYVVQNLLAR